MEMIKSRIQSSHTYNEEVAEEIIDKIIHQYNDLFSDLYIKMEPLIRLSDEKIWLETRTY
ncbi:nucleotidyltransferase substrate binding protein [Dyadobacter subterraneus]